jgi:hypothetical protein
LKLTKTINQQKKIRKLKQKMITENLKMILMLLFLANQILAMDRKILKFERKTIEEPWGITIFGEYPWSIVNVKEGPFLNKVEKGWTILSIDDIKMDEESEKQLDELFKQETQLLIEFDTSKETQTKNLDRHSKNSELLVEQYNQEMKEKSEDTDVHVVEQISEDEKFKQLFLQKPAHVGAITSRWELKMEFQYSPSRPDPKNLQDAFQITLDGNHTILFDPEMIRYFDPANFEEKVSFTFDPKKPYGNTTDFTEKVSFSFDFKTKTFELQGESSSIGPLQFKTLKFEKFGLDTPNSVYRSIIDTFQLIRN